MNARRPIDRLGSIATTAALLIILPFLDALAATVTVAWNPPASGDHVAGYKIYYGLASRVYTGSVDVGNVTEGSVSNLDSSLTYYFAITAYNQSLNESDYSAELVWDNTAPTIAGPNDLTLTADASGTVQLPDLTGQTGVSDNFSTLNAIIVTQAPAAGTSIGVGTTVVTLTATDEAGNISSCTVHATVSAMPIPIPQPPTGLRIQHP